VQKGVKRLNLFRGLVLLAWTTVAAQGFATDGPRSEGREGHLPKKGEYYELVRPSLLSDGWEPVPTTCSTKNICLKFPEIATNMDTGRTCGFLSRKGDLLEICIGGGVADALPVESATLNPVRGTGD